MILNKPLSFFEEGILEADPMISILTLPFV